MGFAVFPAGADGAGEGAVDALGDLTHMARTSVEPRLWVSWPGCMGGLEDGGGGIDEAADDGGAGGDVPFVGDLFGEGAEGFVGGVLAAGGGRLR